MKRKLKLLLILLCASLLLVACGKGAVSDNDTYGTLEVDGTSYLTYEPFPTSEEKLYVNKFTPIPIDFSITDVYNETIHSKTYSATYGDKAYILLSTMFHDGSDTAFEMYCLEMGKDSLEKIDFSLSFLNDMEYNWIQSMEITGPDEITFIINVPADEMGESPLLMCKTDTTGQLLEELHTIEDILSYPVDSLVDFSNVYHFPGGDIIVSELVQANGDNPQIIKLNKYNPDTGETTSITELPNEYLCSLYSDGQDTIYFISNSRLIAYDTKNKTGELKCNLLESGISIYNTHHLLVNDVGEFAIFLTQGERTGIYYFTDKEPDETNSIRLVRLTQYGMEYVTQQAGMFYYDKGHYIRTEKEDSLPAQDAFKERIMAEIVAGGGPELLWVSEEDLYTLTEKGVLMDLSELLSPETKAALLPGVLQLGTVNNVLYAITPAVNFDTLVTNRTIWEQDSWNTREMMNAAKALENSELPLGYMNMALSPASIFYLIFMETLGSSNYIDLEQGISYFNQQDFIDVLEFCTKYGIENGTEYTAEEYVKLMQEGQSLAYKNSLYQGMEDFSKNMQRYGENCNFVGYPVEDGSGNFLSAEGYLVVNANAVHLDEIKKFIEYLLSYDRQFAVFSAPVRRDVLRDRIIENPHALNDREKYVISRSNPNSTKSAPVYSYIDLKPDGSTYLEEFMEFAESCEPRPYCPEYIKSMVWEEIVPYFSGIRTAKEAADMLHSRVQLYLDEHK